MKISEIFKLNKSQFELDFVDIDTNIDLPLFLDPYFISKCEFPFANEAHKTIKSFFNFLLNLLKQGDIDTAREIFSYLGEPNEICLGFTKGNPAGRGIGLIDTEKIFEQLLKSKAIESGVMEDIEDFRIFVPNVERDKVSDMTANIIRKHLIEYTNSQCNLWGIPLTDNVPSGYYWNRQLRRWDIEYTKMLVVQSKKILLVPKRIVSYSKEYTAAKYLQHFVLNFLQDENLRLNTSLVQRRYYKNGDVKECKRWNKHRHENKPFI